MPVLIGALNQRFDPLRPVLVSASKSALSAAVMGAGIYCLQSSLLTTHPGGGFWGVTINLGGLILSGIAIYFLVARLIGCRELNSLRDMFHPRSKTAKKQISSRE